MNEKLYKEFYEKKAQGNFNRLDFAKKKKLKINTLYKYLKEVQLKRAGIYEVIGRLKKGESLEDIEKSYN